MVTKEAQFPPIRPIFRNLPYILGPPHVVLKRPVGKWMLVCYLGTDILRYKCYGIFFLVFLNMPAPQLYIRKTMAVL